ncbi:Flp family type IVb pilin [Variovorax sp. RO1]|jgi:pilus assembly protein Flp/PilA|uniref:Flp family type IVb pilin n=1 Tax=Variovorax sp. RO1 TaxID=2066034 RepID=UPI000C717EBB|nr:Flp family type IVb pilin [Variovorax sp. RO1]PLC05885.1 Flp family type IVb pilin [Variovorax sp. RO1]
MLSSITRFLRDEEGATAIEYGLIAGLIAAVLVLVLTNLGTQVKSKFSAILVALGGTAVP